jgi:hypothetical protein
LTKHIAHNKRCWLYARDLNLKYHQVINNCVVNDNNSVTDPDTDPNIFCWNTDSSSDSGGEDIEEEDASHQDQKRPRVQETIIPFTKQLYFDVQLCKLLDEANAPAYLYASIKKWASEAYNSGIDFNRGAFKRKTVLAQTNKWLDELKIPRPVQVPVELKTKAEPIQVEITAFDFKAQFFSLINDLSIFGDLNNLDVNPSNPFGVYESPDGIIDCVNAASWYRNAAAKYVKDENTMLFPIIYTYDETLANAKKTKIAPLNFTTSIINQENRNHPRSWRTQMFSLDVSLFQSQSESSTLSPEQKSQQRHDMFRAGLQSYLNVELEGGFKNVTLTLGSVTKTVNIVCQVIFISGDMQGGDNLAGCSISYLSTMKRLCRKCNVSGKNAGDPFVRCEKISMTKMNHCLATNDTERLKRYNQYNISSPWFELQYGGDRFGIFSAAMPVEPLHSVELGLIDYCLGILWNEYIVNKPTQAAIDREVAKWESLPRQRFMSSGSEKSFPRLLWKDGISNLTLVEACYRVGIMFTIVMFSLTDSGKKMFEAALGADLTKKMRKVFQRLLIYWQYLHKKSFWQIDDHETRAKVRDAIRQLLNELVTLWPRHTGQGWCLAKFHEQLHVVDDIQRNGPPGGTNTHVTEHHHVGFKNLARRTQQIRLSLDEQLGNRIHEAATINLAYDRMYQSYQEVQDMSLHADPKQKLQLVMNSASTFLKVYKNSHLDVQTEEQLGVVWSHLLADPNKQTKSLLPDCAFQAVQDAWAAGKLPRNKPGEEPHTELWDGKTTYYHCHSEIRWDGHLFRAHQDFRKTGPWHDWVMIRYLKEESPKKASVESIEIGYPDDEHERSQHLYAPGRILAFLVRTCHLPFKQEDNMYALLQMCDFRHTKGSLFTTSWKDAVTYGRDRKKMPYFEVVKVKDHFVRPCLMVPTAKIADRDGYHCQEYQEVWPKELWADQFC